MGVGFVATDVERTARVADNGSGISDSIKGHAIFRMSDGLGLVDVTEREVVIANAEAVGILRLDFANLKVVTCGVHACHGEVTHHDDRFTIDVTFIHLVENRLQLS